MCSGMVIDYFTFRLESYNYFGLFSALPYSLEIKPLDDMGATASLVIKQLIFNSAVSLHLGYLCISYTYE